MGWPDVSLTSQQFKLFDLVPEFHILWGSSIYRSQKGKEDTRERVAEQEALGQPDYLELRVVLLDIIHLVSPNRRTKIKTYI